MLVAILAAGLSRRMGKENKLLIKLGEYTIIEHVLRSAKEYTDNIVVVTGYESDKIEKLLAKYNVKTLYNEKYILGQEESQRVLINKYQEDMIIVSGDVPLLTKDDFIKAEEMLFGFEAARPIYNNELGQPVAIKRSIITAALEGEQNLRDVIKQRSHNFYQGREENILDVDDKIALERVKDIILKA